MRSDAYHSAIRSYSRTLNPVLVYALSADWRNQDILAQNPSMSVSAIRPDPVIGLCFWSPLLSYFSNEALAQSTAGTRLLQYAIVMEPRSSP